MDRTTKMLFSGSLNYMNWLNMRYKNMVHVHTRMHARRMLCTGGGEEHQAQIRQIERSQENMTGKDTNNSKMPRRKEK